MLPLLGGGLSRISRRGRPATHYSWLHVAVLPSPSLSSPSSFREGGFRRKGHGIRFLSTVPASLDHPSLHEEFKVSVVESGSNIAVTPPPVENDDRAQDDELSQIINFPAWWLWTQKPQALHSSSGQRRRTLGYIPSKLYQIVDAEVVTSDSVDDQSSLPPPPPPGSYHSLGNIYQGRDYEPSSDNEDRILLKVTWVGNGVSYYDWEWLVQFAPSVTQWSTSSSKTRIHPSLAIGAIDNPNVVPIPTLDYQIVMGTTHGQLKALDAIMEHGALLIPEAPVTYSGDAEEHGNNCLPSDQVVAGIGKHLSGGRLSHGSLYGDTFRVVNQPNAQNIAYTNAALAPHQDLTYYESKPFLQILQCASNTGQGGASVLIDAMAAAEFLRTVAPDLFGVLCHVEATFVKQRPGADMVSFKPHIRVSSQTGEVVEVNWSPPFEGPPPLFSRKEESDAYLMAYQALECLLDNQATWAGDSVLEPALRQRLQEYSRRHTWEYVLNPGDILVFNNQRMCHARRGFSLTKGKERHLIGCYTDAMETISTYRLLLREQRGGGMTRSVGNGTRGSRI